MPVSFEDIVSARQRIRTAVRRTPLFHSHALSRRLGLDLFVKAEMLQRTGSFKLRGALNKILQLAPEQRQRGVVAASAGNHAQGVAVAAALTGVTAVVVMPATAPEGKVAASRAYGAEVILHGAHYDDAHDRAVEVQRERGLTMIPGFDDPAIVAGQGTIGLEILDELSEFDAVLVPVGGGGLIAGVALAVKASLPGAAVIGVQSAAAPSLSASLKAGSPVAVPVGDTIADGIAVERLGAIPFAVIQRCVDDAIEVSDADIRPAVAALLQRAKLVAEGAGAVPLAALMSGAVGMPGKRVVLVLSGGNIDFRLLSEIAAEAQGAARAEPVEP
ncbi:MAG TPA: threonine ammonia-lyase [Chloroflexota bacterium]|nr:threonine ammonia-lyase [Chloroflexota bacterium]